MLDPIVKKEEESSSNERLRIEHLIKEMEKEDKNLEMQTFESFQTLHEDNIVKFDFSKTKSQNSDLLQSGFSLFRSNMNAKKKNSECEEQNVMNSTSLKNNFSTNMGYKENLQTNEHLPASSHILSHFQNIDLDQPKQTNDLIMKQSEQINDESRFAKDTLNTPIENNFTNFQISFHETKNKVNDDENIGLAFEKGPIRNEIPYLLHSDDLSLNEDSRKNITFHKNSLETNKTQDWIDETEDEKTWNVPENNENITSFEYDNSPLNKLQMENQTLLTEEKIFDRYIQITKISEIYHYMHLLIQHSEGCSDADFLMDQHDFPVAKIIEDEIFINREASIKLMKDVSICDQLDQSMLARKLLEFICLCSTDMKLSIQAIIKFANSFNQQKSAILDKIIDLVIIKEEKLFDLLEQQENLTK